VHFNGYLSMFHAFPAKTTFFLHLKQLAHALLKHLYL
jgi:hypothetical protein